MLRNLILLTFLVSQGLCQTPVIGGTCKLGTADVQIGGKQTQFFLKCETTADSADGEGVWVVKSRAAAAAAPAPATLPTENTQPQQHPKARKPASPNICEQDNGARENEACAVSATCLQAHNDFPSSYLQCDQTTLRWVRKSCQENFLFNFEQQTCIVPKRMSSLSRKFPDNLITLPFSIFTAPPSSYSNSSNPCSKCPLGSACRDGKCIPLTTSNLCSDGSPPNNTCPKDPSQCPKGYICTAQKVCCPSTALQSSIGCSMVCTIDESCPKGMTCQNNCCEERKILRHPKVYRYATVEATNTIFEVDNDIFDSAAIESFPTRRPQKLEEVMAPGITPTPTRTTEPPKLRCLSTDESNSSDGATTSCGGTNANCTIDEDCPISFKCSQGCCKLAKCPRSLVDVRFTCTSQYHCRSNEHCIFGGCCPKNIELAVIKSGPETMENKEKPGKNENKTPLEPPKKIMIGDCEIDPRVRNCGIENVCPDMSECVDGVCCKQPPLARCGNGLMALTIPVTCDLSDDCPISSRCEYGKCCPLTSSEEASEASEDIIKEEVTSTATKVWKKVKKVEKGVSINKNNCLSSQICDLHTLCPPEFTCSLSGKCCKLNVRCPDGTVPETSCESANNHDTCPSSSHKCTLLNHEHFACCYSPGLVVEGSVSALVSSDSDCPMGSIEVDPRFGNSCRYSLQCPSPYFCNQKGRCCQLVNKPTDSCAPSPAAPTPTHAPWEPVTMDTAARPDPTLPQSLVNSDSTTNQTASTSNSTKKHISSSNMKKHRKPKKKEQSPSDPLLPQNDFPIGPPGYGFPEHLSKLDEVLIRAQGDGVSCAGGFQSSLICSAGSECPAGLHCDTAINLCCPLLLPLTDPKNPKKRKTKRRKQKLEEFEVAESPVTKEPPARFSSYTCGCSNTFFTIAPAPSNKSQPPLNSNISISVSGGSSNCVGCQNAPQIITIPQSSCPGGGYSVGGCSSGYCATGYSCIQNQCCPSYNSAPRISVCLRFYKFKISDTCPSGGNAVGACMSGRCASGYTCSNNVCCPQTTTTNPFVCPDGTQAAGGCVNGQCGTGYTCSNGLCCAGTSTTVKCLDGSDAVGACIPSCTGDGCGGVQVSYYCGSGYTCTTGNICCPINSCPNGGEVLGPTINGLCPTGYTVQGNLCCSATCSDGSTGLAAVNGVCIAGYTLTNGVCCPSSVTCTDEISIGPCTGTGFNGGCPAGYACDSNNVNCCPVVTYDVESCQVGPAIDGLCPPGYVVVYIPNSPLITNGVNPGTCIDLQCTTGLCAAANQIGECDTTTDAGTCPTGYTCFTNAGICCQTTTFSRLRIGNARQMAQKPNYGRPLHSYMPPRLGGPSQSSSCCDGSLSSGPCMNGLCGIGLECQNGQCCSPSANNKPVGFLQSKCPSGDTAVSGCFPNGSCGTGFECVSSLNLCCPPGQPQTFPSFPGNNVNNNNNNNNNGFNTFNNNNNRFGSSSMSPRPIGARCQLDGECVGHNDGLSMCHAGVCQCSPIAYTQGIACVRRNFPNERRPSDRRRRQVQQRPERQRVKPSKADELKRAMKRLCALYYYTSS
ncbi:Protein CBG10108 [Caenorhabditis briggsae]|uniref:Protein CBG10108 n=1 Tax=Caenorhabditis briggsae TaxID=6238 RepID=A8XAE7_CAEBR|nr:Protein CBG10108 [Caenorhabditis briggsae]CAP29615.2 Protein CBG10108 [Caenorhabditis briggsae]